jgi:cell division protein FtsL
MSMMKDNTAKRKSKGAPQWVGFAIIVSITFMLALVINFRAYSTMNRESTQHDSLNQQVENLRGENLALQDEILSIKSDPQKFEREARKLGLGRPDEKVPLPAN